MDSLFSVDFLPVIIVTLGLLFIMTLLISYTFVVHGAHFFYWMYDNRESIVNWLLMFTWIVGLLAMYKMELVMVLLNGSLSHTTG